MFAFGAILLSHPFEVARVMIVNGEKDQWNGQCWKTLKALYAGEGVVGLYRGFVPSTI